MTRLSPRLWRQHLLRLTWGQLEERLAFHVKTHDIDHHKKRAHVRQTRGRCITACLCSIHERWRRLYYVTSCSLHVRVPPLFHWTGSTRSRQVHVHTCTSKESIAGSHNITEKMVGYSTVQISTARKQRREYSTRHEFSRFSQQGQDKSIVHIAVCIHTCTMLAWMHRTGGQCTDCWVLLVYYYSVQCIPRQCGNFICTLQLMWVC